MTDTVSLEEIYKAMPEYKAGDVVSVEGFAAFLNLIGAVKDKLAAFLQINQPAIVFQPGTRLKDIFKKRPYTSFAEVKVRMPEAIKTDMSKYIGGLEDILDDLEDIKKDMLVPLRDWAAGTLSTPGFADKAWLDSKVKIVKLDKLKKEFAKYYDPSISDLDNLVPLYKAYPTEKAFLSAAEDIADLVETVNEIHDSGINGVIKEILDYTNQLKEVENERGAFEKTPAATMARVSELLYSAAESVEFLAIIMFQVDVTAKSYTEMTDKLKGM